MSKSSRQSLVPPLPEHTPRQTLRRSMSAATLLSMFGATRSPSSVSRANQFAATRPVSLSSNSDDGDDLEVLPSTAHRSHTEVHKSQERAPMDDSQDLRSDDSVLSNIDVKPASPAAPPSLARPPGAAQITPAGRPTRSTRAQVSYAPPVKSSTPKSSSKKPVMKPILESDTVIDLTGPKPVKAAKIIKPDTARNRVRDEIATTTKVKRDAYLLYHQELFLPLLPRGNYIAKLAQAGGMQSISPHQQIEVQPKNVRAVMKPYQLKGLSFLATMYNNGMSAILGDEMGLGKTLQTLSLFQYLEETHPSPLGLSRPYLVVCPLSVLESWYNECRKWTPNLRPMRFHGSASEREHLKAQAAGKVDRFGHETNQARSKRSQKGSAPQRGRRADEDSAGFDVMITTYEVFVAESNWFKQAFVWRYVVLDEGHKIKNEKSNVSHALQSLKAEHRLLLTGTPLQNNLREMWALLHWLFPDVFTEKTSDMFTKAFDLSKGKVSTSFMDDARRLLELVMLRRLKSSPGVNLGLPPKTEILLYVPLTPVQRFWYTRLLTKAGSGMIEDLFGGVKEKERLMLKAEQEESQTLSRLESAVDGLNQNGDQWAESRAIIQNAIQNDSDEKETGAYKKLLNLVMQLRKCCVHPYQIKGAAPEPYLLGDHIIHASGKFLVLSKLVEELVINQKKKILIFSGFTHVLDYCEDLLSVKGANQLSAPFRYLRLDGSTARAKRNLDIRLFNDLDSDYKIMLISTKAGGLGLNLATATDVVFMDEEWNPQITLQAEARAHRIGQTKPVTIYKICTQGTVEEQMMGRIRKKLYLSAKITESMQDIHSTPEPKGQKRKRGTADNSTPAQDDNAPHLGTSQLMSLIRRGATTLAHPQIDVNEMLSWDFATIIEKCKDRPIDPNVAQEAGEKESAKVDENEWLARMEKVETAVLDGVKYQREAEAQKAQNVELNRSDRRVNKNTTVMVDGFAINKESLRCADWEAVPTMAGKDPRLADVKRQKAPPIQHQDFCQVCRDGGEVMLCAGCPRVYHHDCLSDEFRKKTNRSTGFHCPQHQCADCGKNTSDAGSLIYRCRWCERGHCEDCLDWNSARLLGGTLPEYDMLAYTTKNAWYVECHSCVELAGSDSSAQASMDSERSAIEKTYEEFLQEQAAEEQAAYERFQAMHAAKAASAEEKAASAEEKAASVAADESMTEATTLQSSGVTTPQTEEPAAKKQKRDEGEATAGGFGHANLYVSGGSSSPDIHPAMKKLLMRRGVEWKK